MFEIYRFNKEDEILWDEFVLKSNNGTLFHLRSFLNYHPNNRFVDHSLMILKKGKLFSVFPAAEIIYENKLYLISHPGASVGSLYRHFGAEGCVRELCDDSKAQVSHRIKAGQRVFDIVSGSIESSG